MQASMLKHLAAYLLGLAALFATLTQAAAEKRVALVIGNAAYQHAPPLRNPSNDATDIAAKLRELGFDVVEGIDLGKRARRGDEAVRSDRAAAERSAIRHRQSRDRG